MELADSSDPSVVGNLCRALWLSLSMTQVFGKPHPAASVRACAPADDESVEQLDIKHTVKFRE